MAYGEPTQFVASAARTTSGNSGAQPAEKALNLALVVEVTASSGTTPTLDLTVEWSMDGTNFAVADPADSFTQITTSPTRRAKTFTVKGTSYRLVWTIAGTTPSFTFSATRYAVGQ